MQNRVQFLKMTKPDQKRGQLTNKIIMQYTEKEIQVMKSKADKWDALGAEIEKCYCNSDGEYDDENSEIMGADLCTIGEMAATAFGWL